MKDRRTKEGYKLRVYMDQIKAVKAMTDEEWVDQWAKYSGLNDTYVTRISWISYLEQCVMNEVNSLIKRGAA
jgi:hypothetical protein